MPLHPFINVPLPETYPAGLPGLYFEMGYLLIHDKLVYCALRNVEKCGKAFLIKDRIFPGALAVAGDHGLKDFGNPLGYGLNVQGFKFSPHGPNLSGHFSKEHSRL